MVCIDVTVSHRDLLTCSELQAATAAGAGHGGAGDGMRINLCLLFVLEYTPEDFSCDHILFYRMRESAFCVYSGYFPAYFPGFSLEAVGPVLAAMAYASRSFSARTGRPQ